jgi:hypothetical protein
MNLKNEEGDPACSYLEYFKKRVVEHRVPTSGISESSIPFSLFPLNLNKLRDFKIKNE